MNNKDVASIVLISLLLILFAGIAGYFVLTKKSSPPSRAVQIEPTTTSSPSEVSPPAWIPTAGTAADGLDLTYPDGGEILGVTESMTIRYKVSDELKRKLSASDRREIYLLDSNNVLVGYVGSFDVNSSMFVWDPGKLTHNGGLDVIVRVTPPGRYHILLLVRHAFQPKCTSCDAGVDTLDSPYVTYELGILKNGSTLLESQPIASDVSASFFTIK